MGLHFGGHTPSSRGCAAANRGGIAPSKAPTRRRHAARGLRMAQNPHRSQPQVRRIATRPGHSTGWREKVRPTPPLQWHFREKLAQQAQKRRIWGVVSVQGELFRAHTHHQTKQGELFLACRRWPTSATPQPPAQRARQGLAAVPAGSGVARPRHSWAAAWPGRASRRRTEPTARGRAAAHGAAQPHNAAARPQPGYATRSSPSEPCARAGASHPGRSGCGPRCAAPRLRCR